MVTIYEEAIYLFTIVKKLIALCNEKQFILQFCNLIISNHFYN